MFTVHGLCLLFSHQANSNHSVNTSEKGSRNFLHILRETAYSKATAKQPRPARIGSPIHRTFRAPQRDIQVDTTIYLNSLLEKKQRLNVIILQHTTTIKLVLFASREIMSMTRLTSPTKFSQHPFFSAQISRFETSHCSMHAA